MTDDKVVTHHRFGGLGTADRLREAGVDVRNALTQDQVDEMKLPEPRYGEATVGTCTDEEAVLYRELWGVQQELEDKSWNLAADALTRIGATIRESDRGKPMHELIKSGEMELSFDSDDDAEVYFRLQQRAVHLHAMFYWMIGERLGNHRSRLGVRSRMRIVTVEKRY